MFDFFNFAYLDPATGSIVIQSIIGVVAGVTVFGRNAISSGVAKAKRLFTKDSGDKSEAKTEQQ